MYNLTRIEVENTDYVRTIFEEEDQPSEVEDDQNVRRSTRTR